MIQLVYKPVSLLGGVLAGVIFKRVWEGRRRRGPGTGGHRPAPQLERDLAGRRPGSEG